MTKDELKNRISLALKDPVLQQGFEIICKENTELSERLLDVSEQLRLLKEMPFSAVRQFTEVRTQELLAKAKEIIKKLIDDLMTIDGEQIRELKTVKEAEQFLSEVEKTKEVHFDTRTN